MSREWTPEDGYTYTKTEIMIAMAKAFIDQGDEDKARSLITKIVEDGLKDESIQSNG